MPLPDGGIYEDLCFHAQQAAEKAVYRAGKREFRYTHDIAELLDGLTKYGIPVPEAVRDASGLTNFAWQSRYPGPFEPVSDAEYRRAVALAEAVVSWAETVIEKGRK